MLFIIFVSLIAFTSSSLAFGDHDIFPDKTIHLKLGAEFPAYNMEFESPSGGKTLNFLPNLHQLQYVGVSYKNLIGVSWGFKGALTPEENAQRGETRYEDWRLNYAFKKFLVGVNYSQYSGFYLENSNAVDPAWSASLPFLQYPSMYARNWGAHFTWVWSPEHYSVAALMDQTVRQKKTGGSFLFGGNLGQTVFRNPNGLIPTSVRGDFGDFATIKNGEFSRVHGKGGYGWTWIGGKYFLGGFVMFGLGLQKSILQRLNLEPLKSWDISPRLDALLGGGYNGDTFYLGLTAMGWTEFFTNSDFEITNTIGGSMIYIGWHI